MAYLKLLLGERTAVSQLIIHADLIDRPIRCWKAVLVVSALESNMSADALFYNIKCYQWQ